MPRGGREEPQHGAGDDAEGALRADEELREVVAGVVLAERRGARPTRGRRAARPRGRAPARGSCRSAAPRCRRRWSTRLPPMVQLPSEPSDIGKSRSTFSAAACTSASTTPASTVTVPATGSTSRTRRIRPRESTTWLPDASGTPPPTSPVLPPCGTTATPAAAQAATTAATSSVEPGRTTARARPAWVPVQSTTYAATSASSVRTWSAPMLVRSWSSRSSMVLLWSVGSVGSVGRVSPAARRRAVPRAGRRGWSPGWSPARHPRRRGSGWRAGRCSARSAGRR